MCAGARKSAHTSQRAPFGIVAVNATDADWTRNRYLLAFGAYGWTLLLVWANSLDDALDECVDWIAEKKPGLLCNEQVKGAFEAAKAEGLSDEKAHEQATCDMTSAGNYSDYIASWEWGIVAENPSRADILEILGRPDWSRGGR